MNEATSRIILIGFMAAGKTTVARSLAARLRSAMIDMDDLVAARAGRSIRAIIDEDGEANFRRLETEVLRDLLAQPEARVIALGGGTWTIAANRALINDAGDCLVVWLDAPFALCWQRITNAADTRPLARSYDQAQALYRARHALYELAELCLPMPEERSADEAATEIMSIIERRDFAQ